MGQFDHLLKILAVALLAAVSILQTGGTFAADTLIRDNGGPGTSAKGNWNVSSGANPYGANSYFASLSGESYTYSFDLNQPGEYKVFARWTEWQNRRTSVPYDIYHATGKETVKVNQQVNGGAWQRLGDTWRFGDTAKITIRSLGNGTTSADAIKLVYAGDSAPPPPIPSSGFPVDLRGNTPEQSAVTLNISKPAYADSATITLTTYDADFPDEGELIINGNKPVSLFGNKGTSGNDQNSADISFSTPAAYWVNGNNTLVFRHVKTQGFIIDAATVSFADSDGAANTTPTISGTPATSILVGNNYNFRPIVNDADGDTLSFLVANLPTWASFNKSTGRLSGIPGDPDIGIAKNIIIYVSDGQSFASLPPFNISVQDTSGSKPLTGSTSLSWTAPVARADGSALSLSEIAGYTIHYGTTAGNYPYSRSVNGGTSTSATLSNLPVGTYYMVVTTRDSAGRESGYSTIATKQVK